jgi:hypothetical protein
MDQLQKLDRAIIRQCKMESGCCSSAPGWLLLALRRSPSSWPRTSPYTPSGDERVQLGLDQLNEGKFITAVYLPNGGGAQIPKHTWAWNTL